MMKKLLLPLAVVALLATSCNTDVKDSHTSVTYAEYNLIEDLNNPSQPATASEGSYKLTYNISRNVIDINAPEIIINNQKSSFQTDTMGIKPKVFGDKLSYMGFSSSRNVGQGATVTNLQGYLPTCYVPLNSNILSSSYKFEYSYEQRLQLEYDLNGNYHVTTFWPQACFVGSTYVTNDATSYSTNDTGFVLNLDFSKKIARVYMLGVKLAAEDIENAPKVIVLDEVPVTMSHNGFYLDYASPKTTIPGVKDNQATLVETDEYKVTDFSLHLSQDLTEASINFKVLGKMVNFHGCSIIKSLN